MYHMTLCCWCITIGNVIFCCCCQFFCCTLCTPCWNILDICETDKKPINSAGFPAPFAPMIICCCILTGIHKLCLSVLYIIICLMVSNKSILNLNFESKDVSYKSFESGAEFVTQNVNCKTGKTEKNKIRRVYKKCLFPRSNGGFYEIASKAKWTTIRNHGDLIGNSI